MFRGSVLSFRLFCVWVCEFIFLIVFYRFWLQQTVLQRKKHRFDSEFLDYQVVFFFLISYQNKPTIIARVSQLKQLLVTRFDIGLLNIYILLSWRDLFVIAWSRLISRNLRKRSSFSKIFLILTLLWVLSIIFCVPFEFAKSCQFSNSLCYFLFARDIWVQWGRRNH